MAAASEPEAVVPPAPASAHETVASAPVVDIRTPGEPYNGPGDPNLRHVCLKEQEPQEVAGSRPPTVSSRACSVRAGSVLG